MSFIYDNEKLLAELIKSAVDHEVKFNKRGQIAADPAVNVEFRNYLSLSQKLAEQLKNVYFPQAEAGVVSTATGKDAPMGVPDLASLGNFFDFIVNNQITVDGKRVAYGAGEQNPDPNQYLPVTAEQIKFMTETMNQQGERGQFQADYYVSKNLLIAYITNILKNTSKQDERAQQFIKAMLGARLQDINRIFRTKLTTDYKEPEKPIDDNKEVDRFPKIVENFSNLAQAGSEPLLYKDIKSLESLNAWFGARGIGHKTEDQKTVTIKDQDFNLCAMINYMYGRATLLYQRRTAESGPVMQAYVSRMTDIAKQAGCELTQPGGQPQQQGGQGGQGGQMSPQIAQQLMSLLPFNSQNVNFREIKKFVDTYAKFQPNRSDITGMARQINESIDAAQKLMKQPSMIVDLQQLKAPNDLSAYHAFAKDASLADVLWSIVHSAGLMYTDFVNTISNVLGRDATLENRQQVDAGGPWSVNMGDINQFRTDLAEEVKSPRHY